MKRISIRLTLLLPVMMLGCTPVQYVPFPDQSVRVQDPTQARVYVLRPAMVLGGALSIAVRDGNREIGCLGGGSFLCWERDPGVILVRVKEDASFGEKVSGRVGHLRFTVEPGEAYYVVQHVPFRSIGLDLVSEKRGKRVKWRCRAPTLELAPREEE